MKFGDYEKEAIAVVSSAQNPSYVVPDRFEAAELGFFIG